MVTDCGLSLLVPPTFVEAKLNDGGCDRFTSTIWFVPLYETKISPAPSTATPYGVAVDGAGDIFVSYNGTNQMVEVNRSQPPSLSFASTNVGGTSSDSPQSVTIQNIGNQPLDAVSPGLVVGTNFVKVAGSGTPADCTSTFALTPGASCNVSISFEPQTAGNPLTSTAVFTDNALNASPSASQTIALAGTGTQTGTTTAVTANPVSPIVSGQSETL